MAGVDFIVRFTGIIVPLGTTKTLAVVGAASNHRTRIKRVIVTCSDATTSDKQCRSELCRTTDAGTPGGDGGAATTSQLYKISPDMSETLQSSATRARSTSAAWTTEPTLASPNRIFGTQEFSPVNGWAFDPGDTILDIPGSGFMSCRLTNGHTADRTFDVEFVCSE